MNKPAYKRGPYNKEGKMKAPKNIENPEKEMKRLKAESRKFKRQVKQLEKSEDLTDKIVGVIKDSVESIPPIKLPKVHVYKDAIGEEVAGLLFSDSHIGKLTVSYNHKVFAKRLDKLRDSMFSIVEAHRSIRPIKKLVIVFNGDIIDAESIYPSQSIDGISAKIIDQIFTVGLPKLTEFLYSCLENFEEVECYCQRGNHGRLNASKWSSSKTTNWDTVMYKALEATTAQQPRIKWHINIKDWKSMFRIQGHGFLACHGDMIRMYYSLPDYGFSRQSLRWANAYRSRIKLTHFLFSHFHSINTGKRFNDIMYYCNGSFVTDDVFGEEKIGVTSVPEQLLFFVHKKFGVTGRYPLSLV